MSFRRSEHLLVIERPDGAFWWHTGLGWADCSPAQADHVRRAERIAPKIVSRRDANPRRGREVSEGVAAFGTPFFVRRA